MFLTRKALPRRTFLRGMGVTVALPLLDAMVPAATALVQEAGSTLVVGPEGCFRVLGSGNILVEIG